MNTNPKCPSCGEATNLTSKNKWRPFCCERCKLIDLGAWIEETNRIPGSEISPDYSEETDTPSQH